MFIIQEEDYKFYEEEFKKHFAPKCILQVPVILQFHLPLPDDTHVGGYNAEEGYAFIFKFKKFSVFTKATSDISIVNALIQEATEFRSYIELMYISADEFVLDGSDHSVGDRYSSILLRDLNSVLVSYSLLSGDIDNFSITHKMLHPLTMCRSFKVDDWKIKDISIVCFNLNLSPAKADLSHILVGHLFSYCFSNERLHNPFLPSESFAIQALSRYRRGYRKESVVHIQTSIESFLKTLYTYFAIKENIPAKTISDVLSNYRNLLEQHFKNRIGGLWDWKNQSAPLGKYVKDTYELRNAIVHGGYEPNVIQTNDAIKSALDLKEYVIELIKLKNDSSLNEVLTSLYGTRSETFSSEIFKTDLAYSILQDQGPLKEFVEKIQESINAWKRNN
jgi:hypothetical protein